MAICRTLGITAHLCLVVVIVVLAAAAMAPRAGAQIIQACDDGLGGNVSYAQRFGAIVLRTDSCFANAITGLRSIASFAYFLALYSGAGAPLQASAIIIDEAASYGAVVSVDVSDLLPTTTGDARAVRASFASPVALDPLRTYLLAFCGAGESTFWYTASVGTELRALEHCYQGEGQGCTSASAVWELDSSPYVALTDIIGSCHSSPSPSPSASQSPPPRSPTPSPSPSPSPSASPARGSSDRLTPGESFGTRAVRFVLSLCALLFS